MRSALWIVLAVLGLFWSAVAWFVLLVAGAGGAVVVGVTRWLDLDPSATQWLADGLSMAGGLAQWLVVFGWALGMVVLGLVGWVAGRANEAVRQTSRHAEMAYGGAAVEGEIRYKKVSETGRSDGKTG